MCLPPVRSPRGLNLFKTEYERADYDLEKWRSSCRWITKRDTAVLDADDGAGGVVRGVTSKGEERKGPSITWQQSCEKQDAGLVVSGLVYFVLCCNAAGCARTCT